MKTEATEWVMVPREPTKEMRNAGYEALCQPWPDDWDVGGITPEALESQMAYRAMVAAAPTPPAPDMEVVREWERRHETLKGQRNSVYTKWVVDHGDRMAAALSAQAMEIKRLTGLHKTADDLAWDMMRRTETAESTLAAQARKIEELERDLREASIVVAERHNSLVAAETQRDTAREAAIEKAAVIAEDPALEEPTLTGRQIAARIRVL